MFPKKARLCQLPLRVGAVKPAGISGKASASSDLHLHGAPWERCEIPLLKKNQSNKPIRFRKAAFL